MNYSASTLKQFAVNYYSIEELEKTGLVKAFYTTNKISSWKYGNGNWQQNYELLGSIPEISTSKMCTTFQTHTSVVRVMKEENEGEGISKPTAVKDYDGIITNRKNFLLCSFEADCVPVYFVDPVKKAIGLSHSGWKGTALLISKNTVEAMTKEFNTNPSDLIVAIGPCACEKCYEVGAELKKSFEKNFDIDKIFLPNQNGKFNLDMKAAIEQTLIKTGVLQENIYSVNRCTIEASDLCSFRRTKSTVDHMLTAIMLS